MAHEPSVPPPSCPSSVPAVANPFFISLARKYKLIEPASPPFPICSNFPFQVSAGIHTSILISESAVGLISACTRQNAGKSIDGTSPGGNLKSPAGTTAAEVIVVFSSCSAANFSHDPCAKAGNAQAASTKNSNETLRSCC